MSASANRCMVMIMWPLLSPAFAADPAPTPPAAPQSVPAAAPKSDAAKSAENARDLHALNPCSAKPPAAWSSKK
jgi:hypothetical protein